MMKAIALKWITVAGLLLFLFGLAWGVYFVGVPYQDPTPAQQAHEALHVSIASWLMGAGFVTLIASGLLAVVRLLRGGANSSPPP